jgi:hypothetical protein
MQAVKAFIAVYRCFLSPKEQVKWMIGDRRPRFVENSQIRGDAPLGAEIHASELLEYFRSFMLEGADKSGSRGSGALLFITFALVIVTGASIVVTVFLN